MIRSILQWTTCALIVAACMSSPAHATSEPAQCALDSHCDEGFVCEGWNERCIPVEDVCVDSTSCAAGRLCTHATSSCPPKGDRCADTEMGFCLDVPESFCSADAECAEDELCWVTFVLECADGDTACEQSKSATCVTWARLCGPDYPIQCSAQESCLSGRCVWEGGEAAALAIVVDADKEARLRPLWETPPAAPPPPDPGDEPRSGGCSAAPDSPAAWPAALLLLALWRRRRRPAAD